jgi:uncharacterized protein (TIGR02596 family)
MNTPPAQRGIPAFSLVELLVVMALIAILAALTVPAVTSIQESSRVSQGLGLVLSTFSLAAQKASAENRPVTVRLIEGTDGEYARLQLVEKMPDNSARALERIVRLPEGLAFATSPNLSSLFSLPERTAGGGDPGVSGLPPGYNFREFQFRPDGRLGLGLSNAVSQAWFLTVVPSRHCPDSSAPPANFATVQVDPVNGRLSVYRP